MSGFDDGMAGQGVTQHAQMWGTVLRGMGPPVPTLGVIGNVYINVQTWDFYEKRADGLTSPWGNPVFVVPALYRTGLKWFVASAPPDDVGIAGDYAILWGSYANNGIRASFYGPKRATGWPENGNGGDILIAAPGNVVTPVGLGSEGAPLPESTSSQLIAVGLDSEVVLTTPIDDSTGQPVHSLGVATGPLQVDLPVSSGFDALNTHGI